MGGACTSRHAATAAGALQRRSAKLFLCSSVGPRGQALSAQGDLEKAKEELKNAMTVVVATAPPEAHAENEHDDEHDENHAEASAELSNEGVSQLDLRSEEARVTEAQKNQRVKAQLQVRVRPARRQSVANDPAACELHSCNCSSGAQMKEKKVNMCHGFSQRLLVQDVLNKEELRFLFPQTTPQKNKPGCKTQLKQNIELQLLQL